MKKKSRIFTLCMAVIMVMSMMFGVVMSANAVDTLRTNITIEGGYDFYAWRLFDILSASVSDDGDAMYAYHLREKYYDAFLAVYPGLFAEVDPEPFLTMDDVDLRFWQLADSRRFYDDFVKPLYSYFMTYDIEPDETTTNGKFVDVPAGYYLIAPIHGFSGSLILTCSAVDDVTLTYKSVDAAYVEKSVSLDGNGYGKYVTANIEDTVYFKLESVVPDMHLFDDYAMVFYDTLANSFTLDEDSISVFVGELMLTPIEDFKIVRQGNQNSFRIVMNDMIRYTAMAGSSIVVTYEAKLNDTAVMGGNGNRNTVYVDYSDNPYSNSTDNSVASNVSVFSFKLKVNKVDDVGNALSGASFKLERKTDAGWDTVSLIDPSDATEFEWNGISAGEYRLTEVKAPDGYYGMENPIEFTITPNVDRYNVLESITVSSDMNWFDVDASTGEISIDIRNFSGYELPETGGLGRFVLVGVGSVSAMLGMAIVVVYIKKCREVL